MTAVNAVTATLEQARAAKGEALKVFSAIGSVVGVGITRVGDGYAVKVNLQQPPRDGQLVPDHVQNVPVQVDVVGTIRKR